MKALLMTSAAALMLSVGAASATPASYAFTAQAVAAQQARSAAAQPDFYGTEWHDEGVATATGGPVGMPRG